MRQQSGLTLVELLVTLAVLAVLVGVAFPGFQGMMARNDMASSVNSLILAANLARGEAVSQAATSTLVARDDAGGSAAWGLGWQVLTVAANAPIEPCAAPDCLRQFDGPGSGLTVASSSGASFVQFGSRGGLVGAAPVRLELCDPGVSGVRVTFTPTGRIATVSTEDRDGDGEPLITLDEVCP